MKRPLQEQKGKLGRRVSPVRRLGFAEELGLEMWFGQYRLLAAAAELIAEECAVSCHGSKCPAVQERTRQAGEKVLEAVEALRRAAELLWDEEAEKLFPGRDVFVMVNLNAEQAWGLYLADRSFQPSGFLARGLQSDETLSDLAGAFLVRHLEAFRRKYEAFVGGVCE